MSAPLSFEQKVNARMQEWKVSVPEGETGHWRVSRFEVSEADASFHNLRCQIQGEWGRTIAPGQYTRISSIRDGTVMSDTPAEIRDHYEPWLVARYAENARVLVHGLGLGVIVQALGRLENVAEITVVEISDEVLSLVAPHYAQMFGERVRFVHGDALTWKPPKGARWDVIWHDIWPSISADNWPTMSRLHRRFGGRCVWQGSWCRAQVEALRRD